MTISLVLVILTVIIAIFFDLVNGFHDAANSIATVVSTRVLTPGIAVVWAAFFNFIAMLIFEPRVADTISKIVRIEMNDLGYVYVIFLGLLAAICWDLITWRLGLPTSSSHALIGGLSGAGVAYAGWEVLRWEMLGEVVAFIILAPLLGFIFGFAMMCLLFYICRYLTLPTVRHTFRIGQLFSAALYSIGHGANDAQKTMGIILAVFIAAGLFPADTNLSIRDPDTVWIILVCQTALAVGTAIGGWRIVKTMGMKIVRLRPIGGFSAETAGAATLFMATHFGIPVSTTHTITGAIIGTGTVSSSLSHIRWSVANNIIWSWLLTIPLTGAFAAALLLCLRLFGAPL